MTHSGHFNAPSQAKDLKRNSKSDQKAPEQPVCRLRLQAVQIVDDREADCGDWRFEVVDLDGRRIDKVLAIPPKAEGEDSR